jgi:hypothetical protein
MSHMIAAPEMMTAAATDLATIDSSLSAAHTAAAAPTVALAPAAADEVSASIAHLFSRYAGGYQALAGQASAFHEQFVQHLKASAGSYASIEAANTSSLRSLDASTGSLHASANAGAPLPVNVSFREVLASLLLLLAGSFALAWQLLLLISHLPITF